MKGRMTIALLVALMASPLVLAAQMPVDSTNTMKRIKSDGSVNGRLSVKMSVDGNLASTARISADSALGMVLLNDQIAALYTRDLVVRDLAATLLLTAAVFQISDGLQVGAAGALRGFKDTTIPMALCWFSYWAVGFALAYVLGVARGGGPVMVWIGLIAGLAVCSILLLIRYAFITRSRRGCSGRSR